MPGRRVEDGEREEDFLRRALGAAFFFTTIFFLMLFFFFIVGAGVFKASSFDRRVSVDSVTIGN